VSDYLPAIYTRVREQYPEVAGALDQLARISDGAGPLDDRSCRLVKLGIAIGALAEGAVRSNARKALDAGITPDEILVQPGAQFPWHQHAGPVIVTVAAGELVYVEADDCVHRSYPAGTVFVDPGNSTHSAFNPTSGVTRLIATFFDVAATGPLTLTQGVEPGDCVLLP
jgi:hypothetical protein